MKSVSEAAKASKCSEERIRQLARGNRIPGARKNSRGQWELPDKWTVASAPVRRRKMDRINTNRPEEGGKDE